MKKVLILNRSLNQGGIDLVGQELAKSLAKKHNVALATFFLKDSKSLESNIKIFDLNIHPSGNLVSKLLNDFLRFHRFSNLAKKEKPDLVIAQGNIPNIVVGLDKRFGASYKAILTVHNTLSQDLVGTGGNFEKFLLKLVKRNADLWVADNDFVAKDFQATIGSEKLAVIPNPISPYQKAEKEFKNKFIFTAGRLVPQKDFETLIKAFAIVTKKINSLDLLIAGEGPQLEALESLSRSLKIENKVKFIGYEKNLFAYLKNCEFFVSSSLYEGMPMVVLQALDLGKSVVATQVPGTMEAVGNAGLFSPVGNAGKLAENMLKLLENQELKSGLEAKAVQRAQQFSAAEIGQKWDKLIGDLLK